MKLLPTTLTSRGLAASAALVTAAFAAAGGAIGGLDFAGGVAVSGGLMLANLVAWRAIVRRLIAGTVAGRTPVGAVLLFLAKIGLLLAGVFAAARLFPPLSVVLGASVVVVAVVAWAVVALVTDLQVEEA